MILSFRQILFFLMVSLLIFVSDLSAQRSSSMSPLEGANQLKQTNETMSNMMMEQLQKNAFPVGNSIDEEYYYVGPNDILTIQIVPADPFPQYYIVTSENSISSQYFGLFSLKDLSLKQIRDTLNFIANSRKGGTRVIVSLFQPRNVVVSIRGNVINPGTFVFPASYSVATAVKFANQLLSTNEISNTEEHQAAVRFYAVRKEREKLFSGSGVAETSTYSSRNIRLFRENGTGQIVDLERATATKDNK
jgi:hypothetical protein